MSEARSLFLRASTTALSTLLAAAVALALAQPAGAAASKPAITFAGAPTVSATTVTSGFSVNRQAKSISSLTCTLTVSGTSSPAPCGDRTTTQKTSPARFAVTIEDLAPGDYTYTVRVRLTDGGGATATTGTFTIASPTITLSAAFTGFTFMGQRLCQATATLSGFSPNTAVTTTFDFVGPVDGPAILSEARTSTTNALGSATVNANALFYTTGYSGTATAPGATSGLTPLTC